MIPTALLFFALLATGSLACFTTVSSPSTKMYATIGSTGWEGMDMSGQGRTVQSSIAACRTHCAQVAGCVFFTFWPGDGGCHIQEGNAVLRDTPVISNTVVVYGHFDSTEPCADADCQGRWSACSAECETAQQRVFFTDVAKVGNGKPCPSTTDCQPGEGACPATAAPAFTECVSEAGSRCGSISPAISSAPLIDAVYLAQTHVLAMNSPYLKLISERAALLKVQVIAPQISDRFNAATCECRIQAPAVSVIITAKDGSTTQLQLQGPPVLPNAWEGAPGLVEHKDEDSYTVVIPKNLVRPGFSFEIQAGSTTASFAPAVGAPNKMRMTMFDMKYFGLGSGDYAPNFDRELLEKWPVNELDVTRVRDIILPELVMPGYTSAPGEKTPLRVSSETEFVYRARRHFDGEQGAALQWVDALAKASGNSEIRGLTYVNIMGVPAGGQALGLQGVGYLDFGGGILHHELGHAFGLPHLKGDNTCTEGCSGPMYGIAAPNNVAHVGPTWAFDLRSRTYINPACTPAQGCRPAGSDVNGDTPTNLVYRSSPMQGGGTGDQPEGFLFRHFSDYEVSQMQRYLEDTLAVNVPGIGWRKWDDNTGAYTKTFNYVEGVSVPVETEIEVYTILISISLVSDVKSTSMLYDPIGPYVSDRIRNFDANVAADRADASSHYCPHGGCDFSIKVTQGNVETTYLLRARESDRLSTVALNLPANQGTITAMELLHTQDAQANWPQTGSVLDQWPQVDDGQSFDQAIEDAIDYIGCYEYDSSNVVDFNWGPRPTENCCIVGLNHRREHGVPSPYCGFESPQAHNIPNKPICRLIQVPPAETNRRPDSECEFDFDSKNRRLGDINRVALYRNKLEPLFIRDVPSGYSCSEGEGQSDLIETTHDRTIGTCHAQCESNSACVAFEVSHEMSNSCRLFSNGYSRIASDNTHVFCESVQPNHASGESGLSYVGCYENFARNRVLGHMADYTIERCEAESTDGFFGMEWPQGSVTAGEAQCLSLQALPAMNLRPDSECEAELDTSGRRLGGSYRLAVYRSTSTSTVSGGDDATTRDPTVSPTVEPTVAPTLAPTLSPTMNPTRNPTRDDATTRDPTVSPTLEPTVAPTLAPTMSPTITPTRNPTRDSTDGSLVEALSYVGCFENFGANRVNGHVNDLSISQCEDRSTGEYFGMEWPQGYHTPGNAQCLGLSGVPVMNRVADSDCEFELDAFGRRLGSGYRLAVYQKVTTNVAPPQTNGGGNVIEVNDFSSRANMVAAGWTFVNEQPGLDFLTMPSHFCTGVPSTSFCGFAFPGELKLTYTFSVSGTVSFDWGHSWWGGSVVVLKNGAEIERLSSRGRQTSRFSAVAGDVLEIKEIDTSVINIHGLTITPTGRRQLTGRLIGQQAKLL